ncbi:DUF4232 domain-containing protein [Streptomyces sp. NPDC002018]|uniref:DUF4232 domain-containing protein n=1 Tax=Streptomyces sp. NPDC002018 TaxID=3364629 RepID=UPI003683AE42
MRRTGRSAMAAMGVLALVTGVAGCSDLRHEIAAERNAPGPRADRTGTPAPEVSGPSSGSDGPGGPGGSGESGESGESPADGRHGAGPTDPAGSVPSAEPAGCPPSGVSVRPGPVDAAMGHRAVVITLENCGERPLRVNGYPEVGVLDADREPLTVKLTHGHAYTDAGRDQGPRPYTLERGDTVQSVLHWNNRITDTRPAGSGAYVVIAPAEGARRNTVPLLLDIGTSGELDVTAWARGPAPRPS